MQQPRWIADMSQPPLAVVHFEDPTRRLVPDAGAMLVVIDEILRAGRPVAGVLDLSGIRPDAQRRAHVADYYQKRERELRRVLVALAVVAPSRILAGAVTAFTWLTRPEMPMKVFQDRTKAMAWAREVAASKGLA